MGLFDAIESALDHFDDFREMMHDIRDEFAHDNFDDFRELFDGIRDEFLGQSSSRGFREPRYGGPATNTSSELCLQCHWNNKKLDYQFCSKACSDAAAAYGSRLIPIPPNHTMYQNVRRQFFAQWEANVAPPHVVGIYLITWSADMRKSFENYRNEVAYNLGISPNKAEVKRFRAERRACNLGEPGCDELCTLPHGKCRLCTAIRTGFAYSLDVKRNAVYRGHQKGVRFGGGLYMAPTSSKAYQYAENELTSSYSPYKAVLMTRTVLGRPEMMAWEDHSKLEPAPGYDSVETCVRGQPTELVVYDEDAARPAYLILLY